MSLICGVAILYCGQFTRAQNNGDLPTPEPASSPITSIQEEPATILYLLDKNNMLVPTVEGARWEEFVEFFRSRLARAERNLPPQFEITELNINGMMKSNRAELQVEIAIRGRVAEEEVPQEQEDAGKEENDKTATDQKKDAKNSWIQVPIRFDEAALVAEPRFRGKNEWILLPSDTTGYHLWYRGEYRATEILELEMVVPVKEVGDFKELQFQVPNATVSKLKLDLPTNHRVSNPVNAVLVEDQNQIEQNTIQASGLKNLVVIRTQPRVNPESRQPERLNAEADIDVTVERIGVITSDVKLDLTSYLEPIDQFVVRVPENSEILPDAQTNCTIRKLDSDADGKNQFQFTLDSPAREPEVIQFRIESAHSIRPASNPQQPNATKAFNVAEMEVLKALRQYGRIRIFLRDDLHLKTSVSENVVRVPNVADGSESENTKLRAAFDYVDQPCKIEINVQQQQSMTTAEPRHVLFINGNTKTLELESQITFRSRGASVSKLSFNLGDWDLDGGEIRGSAYEIIDTSVDPQTRIATVEFSDAPRGEFTVLVSTKQKFDDSNSQLRIELPVPIANTVTSGVLVTMASENVSVMYQNDEASYTEEPLPTDLAELISRFSTQNQDVRAFRFSSTPDQTPLVVNYQLHMPKVELHHQANIQLNMNMATVEQRLIFDIQFRSRSQMKLLFPREIYDWMRNLTEAHRVRISVNGQPIQPFQALTWGLADSSGAFPATLRLQRPAFGVNEVEIQYDWGFDSLENSAKQVDIPLVSSNDGEIQSNRVIITPNPAIDIDRFSNPNWKGTVENRMAVANSDGYPTRVGITAAHENLATSIAAATGTVVDKAWLQTWIAQGRRQDRAVFRVNSTQNDFRFKLPSDIDSKNKVRIRLNNTQIVDHYINAARTESDTSNVLVIDNKFPNRKTHVIELVLFYEGRPQAGAMNIELPSILEAKVDNWVWQLALPPNEHVLRTSGNLTPSHTWSWTGWFWKRRTSEMQRFLEEWTGGSKNAAAPAGANEYLYTTLNPVDRLVVYSATRRWMVAIGSGLAMLFGLLLIYVQTIRKPIIFFALALVLGIFAVLLPGPAVLLAQASILGVCLAIIGQAIALFIRRLSIHRYMPQPSLPSDSHAYRQNKEELSRITTAAFPKEPLSVVSSDSKV